jgi:ASCH domain
MRNISFALTQDQILERSKTVTRRNGWRSLKRGTLLQGVKKSQGLKKGETVTKLSVVRVVDVRPEPLKRMTDDVRYGIAECVKEGFAYHPTLRFPSEFVKFFCASHKGVTPDSEVTRIEFEFVD